MAKKTIKTADPVKRDPAAPFLKAIKKSPNDLTNKLVYADYVDESGDEGKARLIRDLCAVNTGKELKPYAVPTDLLTEVAGWFFPKRTRIDALSTFELALLPWFRESWLAQGLAVGPCDRVACERAVDLAYACAGLQPPKAKVWLNGPLHGAVGAATLSRNQGQVQDQVWRQVAGQVRDQVWDQVWGQVADQVHGQVSGQVRGQVWGQVWDQVRDQVWSQVWRQVRDQVQSQVWRQVRDQVQSQVLDQVQSQVLGQVRDQVQSQVLDQVWRCGYGQHDSSWLAFYATFQAFGLDCSKLKGLWGLSQCGWWWPFTDVVILTERPVKLEMKDKGLKCVEYADGLKVEKD